MTPAARYPAAEFAVTLSGLASSVTSASGERQNESRTASTMAPTSVGVSSDGVPPPKKTDATGRSRGCRRMSATIALT